MTVSDGRERNMSIVSICLPKSGTELPTTLVGSKRERTARGVVRTAGEMRAARVNVNGESGIK